MFSCFFLLASAPYPVLPTPAMERAAMAHTELLLETFEWIKEHRSEHDQTFWGYRHICGTTFCFAGAYATQIAGYDPIWNDNGGMEYVRFPDGQARFVQFVAEEELSLTADQSRTLFNARLNFDDVDDIVHAIVHGEPLPPVVEDGLASAILEYRS